MNFPGRRPRSAQTTETEMSPIVAELFVAAQHGASALRHDVIGTEHVLLALVDRDDRAGRALQHLGLDAAGVRDDIRRVVGAGPEPESAFDAEALSTLGIDLNAVRERVEANFGEGALERASRRRATCTGASFGVAPDLKQALEHARRDAAQRDRPLTAGDIALGLAEQRDSLSARILDDRSISPARLRAALAAQN
jgi:ATP-dependent Clp protease ATP-binding subunit ClpA